MTDDLLRALGTLYLSLLIGSVVRCALIGRVPPEKRRGQLGSLAVWWVLALLTTIICLVGQVAAGAILGILSVLGMREYLALTAERRGHRVADRWAYATVILHYLFIMLGWSVWAAIFLPIFALLSLAIRLLFTGQTRDFVRDVSVLLFGVMLIGYGPSHAAMLFMVFPESRGELAGWFFFLVVLTELNDIAQALWGRQFGKHRVTPHISPRKTWEGLLLGIATTMLVALLLAPLLRPLAGGRMTDLPWPTQWRTLLASLCAGLLIAVGGFLGDLTMSAVKRDAGTKDSGNLLPGQGGILDRIDSLSFTAPLFFFYARFLYGD